MLSPAYSLISETLYIPLHVFTADYSKVGKLATTSDY